MGATTRFGLRFPELVDEANGPGQIQALASDTEGWLARAYPCLSTARPTSPSDGMLIRETDTGAVLIWNGVSWAALDGGGGGGTTGHAQFSGTAQSVPSATDTACGFPTADVASALVVRSAYGAGHQFQLVSTGLWVITVTARYATAAALGERYAGLHIPGPSGGTPLGGAGGTPDSASRPVTLNVAVTRQFASGALVFVNLWQGSGGARALEPGTGGGWVRINLAKVA